MYMLHDLWQGNISPSERLIQKGSEFAKLLHNSAELEAAFCKGLTKDQNRACDELNNSQMQMMSLAQKECFIEGFQIGARMILDVLTKYQPRQLE
jgi:hypothetical protein